MIHPLDMTGDTTHYSSPHIASLSVSHFRNYQQIEITPSSACIILTGQNGAGKTNLLEAISLLSPGRGLRYAKLGDFIPNQENSSFPLGWAIRADLQLADGEQVQIATGKDLAASQESGTERRTVYIHGAAATQNALSEYANILWLTPQQGTLFLDGQSERRKFLDRLVFQFEPAHARHVSAYEQTMRERNQLLYDRCRDAAWFETLEQKMAEHAVVIASYRIQTLTRLNQVIAESEYSFPKAKLSVNGLLEHYLQDGHSSLETEDYFRHQLASSRSQDMQSSRTGIGTHKTELQVIHQKKQQEAANCSTGEQKALLLSIILAESQALRLWGNHAPILLLDEVVAHLDTQRRIELAEAIASMQIQAWLTGTDAESFNEFKKIGDYYRVEDNKLSNI